MPYDFRNVSVWVDEPADLRPPLSADTQSDVVVIGGGFTGLSTALSLRAAGVDVILLEMDYCGKGASGRNAGHLTPTIGKDLPTLVKYVGKARAGELAQFAERAVHYTESLLSKHLIDCDYQPVGNIIAGLHRKHREPLQAAADLAASIGVNSAYLDDGEMRRRGLPETFRFGVLEGSGGHLHPGKYVEGLRRAALAAGVRIYERTHVKRIVQTSAGVRAETGHGSVTSEKLVVATNAYSPSTLGVMRGSILPLRVTLFQTPRLTDRQLKALGWQGREGVYTAHESLESYRITADGRLLGGSKYVQYGFGSSLPTGYRPDLFSRYGRLLAERFPETPDLSIESFWGGWIAMTQDFLPFSHADRRRRIFYGMGYNGHGVAQATYNGSMLADQILGRRNADAELLQRKPPPLPPEPLRWLMVRGYLWLFDRPDRAIDAELRNRPYQPG